MPADTEWYVVERNDGSLDIEHLDNDRFGIPRYKDLDIKYHYDLGFTFKQDAEKYLEQIKNKK